MRTLGPVRRAGAHRPLGFVVFAALVLFSGPALADCTGSAGVNILASGGSTCLASGNYVSTDVIAGQATGAGSVLTNDIDVPASVSFSTSAANTPAVQADAGGLVTLIATPSATVSVSTSGANANGVGADTGGLVTLNGGSVTTTGPGSVGLFANGTDESGARRRSPRPTSPFRARPGPLVTLFSPTRVVKSR